MVTTLEFDQVQILEPIDNVRCNLASLRSLCQNRGPERQVRSLRYSQPIAIRGGNSRNEPLTICLQDGIPEGGSVDHFSRGPGTISIRELEEANLPRLLDVSKETDPCRGCRSVGNMSVTD